MLCRLESERAAFLDAYDHNRRRSTFLFDLFAADAYFEAPIPLRHPFVFYEGHIPAFSFLTLVRSALGAAAIDESLERLFQRGIDPSTFEGARQAAPLAWPQRADVRAFMSECDARVREALRSAPLDEPNNPQLAGAQAVHTILEHELMHQETLLYIVHRLSLERKVRIRCRHEDLELRPRRRVRVEAGTATLGARREELSFGWDNEFEQTRVHVPAFRIDVDNVSNGEYLAFVNEGGDVPPFWREHDRKWYALTQFDLIPLPKSWPVYVTHHQAAAYAAWKGARLPMEAEYHRAAFGTPEGEERAYPWGDAPPDPTRGNFGFARYDPAPVGSYPRGTSAWGVNDLIGNGWEWTSSLFEAFDGFRPMASYPVYSADFFDGEHYVLKGASPVTDRRLVRRTFRNWFRGDYPYAYASFRCVTPE
jgi:formylglycine-generating enzyme required for sulfatase activity